jgi:hypothetical protein
VLRSVLVAHLVNLGSEINDVKNRHNRNATVIWHAKGTSSLVRPTECIARRQNSGVLVARGLSGGRGCSRSFGFVMRIVGSGTSGCVLFALRPFY